MHRTPGAAPDDVGRLLADYAAAPTQGLRDRIVEAHLYIAEIIARRFSGRGVDYEDLYQVAALALVKALDRFDPGRGIRFASFATPAMVGEVRNYFRDKSRLIRLPRRGMELLRRISRATDELAQTLGRMPTSAELAQALEIPEEAVLEAMELPGGATPVSLDAGTVEGEEDAAPLNAFLGMEEPGYSRLERQDAVRRAMARLTGRQREIIFLRYFENLSQRETAARMNVSQMTVSREERRALEAMRADGGEPGADGQ